jgi:hypothetical protein
VLGERSTILNPNCSKWASILDSHINAKLGQQKKGLAIVRYYDSLYILVLPVGSGTSSVLSSNRDALGSSTT